MSSETIMNTDTRLNNDGMIVGIDIGGTFTDTVVMSSDGEVSTYKSFSTPENLLAGFIDNIRMAGEKTGKTVAEFLGDVKRIAHGTTVATNAFIENRGGKVGLITTRGFEDTLVAQRMMGMTAGLTRSELMDYANRSIPSALCEEELIFGVRERIDYAGRVVAELNEADVMAAVEALREQQVTAIAICLLWSVSNPQHELRVAQMIRDMAPEIYVTLSHEVAPHIGEYERMTTTVVNAFLAPVVSSYTERLIENLEIQCDGNAPSLFLLDSIGGVMDTGEASREPVRLLISGPSGGMTACENLASSLGHNNVITFDMGGTSCDVGLIVDGDVIKCSDTTVGKHHLILPKIDIKVIGAGGGSIASVMGGNYLHVGPESAGSSPGPACYGRGGERPTVTDANVVLGILNPDNFLGGKLKLDLQAARDAVEKHVAKPLGIPIEEAAAGIRRIVDNQMYDLLRTETIDSGRDPREFVLYAYGGAGAAHASALALNLVPEVVIPSTHSVHSALGAIASDASAVASVSQVIAVPPGDNTDAYAEVAQVLNDLASPLLERVIETLDSQKIPKSQQTYNFSIAVRYARQSKETSVKAPGKAFTVEGVAELIAEYRKLYAQRYGSEAIPQNVGIELASLMVEARGVLEHPQFKPQSVTEGHSPEPVAQRDIYDTGEERFVVANIYCGEAAVPGSTFHGPAVLEYVDTTIYLPTGQVATIDPYRNIHIVRGDQA